MTNILFLAVLFFSLYYIGKRLGNKNIGVFSAFIVSMYPFVFGLSKTPLPDFALTAMATFSLCCLIYADDFSRKLPSLLFGLSLGLGILTKQIFVFFIATPLCFVIARLFFKRQMDQSRRENLLIVFLTAFFSGGFWFATNLKNILPNYIQAGYMEAYLYGPHKIFSLDSLTFYFWQLIHNQVLPFFSLVFAIGLVSFLLSKIKVKTILLLSIFGAYFIFTLLIPTKEPKSTAPYLPVFALISAAGILNIKSVKLRRLLVVFIILFGFYQYFLVSYTRLTARRYRLPVLDFFIPDGNLEPIISFNHYPVRKDRGMREVLALIKQQERAGHKIVGVSWQNAANMRWVGGIVWRGHYIITNGYVVQYYCKINGLTSEIVSLDNYNLDQFWWNNKKGMPSTLILVDVLEKIAPEDIAKQFRLYKILTMPDKSHAYIYTRI
jgi:hypothetical protein